MSSQDRSWWPLPNPNPVNEAGQEVEDAPKPGCEIARGGPPTTGLPHYENTSDQRIVAEEAGHPLSEEEAPLP